MEAGQVDAAGDVILDPVGIPPLFGVDLDAVELHAEVDVVAAGHAGLAALAQDLALFDKVAFVDGDFAEVAVDGLQTVAVVEHDAVAIDAERGGIDDPAVV